ncbi:hypothetical protein CNMCM5793_007781 [Aspergillus hiratsukae]|uniref:Nephrocystin 3-like N-terminal domain-containing protein n=1 Tax=Aspergillus hiratsukae TaxID=1194566 RepID=A0A8H6UNK8_9EURO|nr:hypothetical protein CNMCM5793_007781 [Aspergillus hiratsukae]KAF7157790.1 hypothetical protein CNMCM6106_003919 [Aspergillus hiratsukae]
MLSSFTAIKFGLMVGIGGGIPSIDNDVRLGDIVFTALRSVAHWTPLHGFCLTLWVHFKPDMEREGAPIPVILEAMYKKYPLMAKPRGGPGYIYQGTDYDLLFLSDYDHAASKKDCSNCDTEKEVVRPERPDHDPYIHYGTIASGNEVVKDARRRDLMSKNCLCFETEAAGLMNDFPCLIIRGICDYCDTHKNDQWQKYAAAVAAAYAKELLQITDAADIKAHRRRERLSISVSRDPSFSLLSPITKLACLGNQKQNDMFEWMSPLNPSARHVENQKTRADGTGTWLLEDPKFLDWSSKTGQCQTLCCYGDPGAGKTIITSNVIDKLEKHIAQKIGLAYIYCDYCDQKEQTTENILGAILKQLLGILPEIPEDVWTLYGERGEIRTPETDEERDEDLPDEWEYARDPTFQERDDMWTGSNILVLTRGLVYGTELLYDVDNQTIRAWQHFYDGDWRDNPAYPMTALENRLYVWTRAFLSLKNLPLDKNIMFEQDLEEFKPMHDADEGYRKILQDSLKVYQKEKTLRDVYLQCGWKPDSAAADPPQEGEWIWESMEEARKAAPHDYTVAWICALPLAMAAAEAMLDERHPDLPTCQGDDNTYIGGRVGSHNVIIACLPAGVYGTTSAATVAFQMRLTFKSIRFGLMVGIAGGE